MYFLQEVCVHKNGRFLFLRVVVGVRKFSTGYLVIDIPGSWELKTTRPCDLTPGYHSKFGRLTVSLMLPGHYTTRTLLLDWVT